MKPANLKYEDVKIGDIYVFEKMFDQEDAGKFAELSGDFNPLHIDSQYAQTTEFKKPVIHGMLLAGLFSRLVGMFCPGRNCLYLSQTLQFRAPVFSGDALTVRGTVTQKTDSGRMVTLKTEILARGEVAVAGEAKAKFITESGHV